MLLDDVEPSKVWQRTSPPANITDEVDIYILSIVNGAKCRNMSNLQEGVYGSIRSRGVKYSEDAPCWLCNKIQDRKNVYIYYSLW